MIKSCNDVAETWEAWCGETAWSRNLRAFGKLGGQVNDFGGVPQSVSAIGLCFMLILPDGSEFPGNSRLKDIRAAVNFLKRITD